MVFLYFNGLHFSLRNGNWLCGNVTTVVPFYLWKFKTRIVYAPIAEATCIAVETVPFLMRIYPLSAKSPKVLGFATEEFKTPVPSLSSPKPSAQVDKANQLKLLQNQRKPKRLFALCSETSEISHPPINY